MSRGPDESLRSSAWLTQIWRNKFATLAAARKKGSIVSIETCNYKLLLKAFLAERSQIVQLFQWLLRRRDNFRSCQTRKEKQCR